eukprot:COSAG02_NODE_3368_length_6859_cov_8.648077_3_plen_622_part_00
MRSAVFLARALVVCCSGRVAVAAPDRTLPPTDDPPQPRCPAWVDGLTPPPAAIDPRRLKALPGSVQQNSTDASSDDGISLGTTPSVFVLGDSMYTMGVTVQQATAIVYAAEYNSFNLHSFNASGNLAFGRRRLVSPKSEFYGFGGIFAVLAEDDGRSLYLAYDGNGCMPGNPASVGVPCAFVRHVELGPTGAERIAVRNLTTPKQMALDSEGRLYVSEEWPEQIVRWDPSTGEQTVVLHNSEYAASGPLEGLAISSNGDIYFSSYGEFGNQVNIATGSVSGVPLKSGAVWVKRGGAMSRTNTNGGGDGAVELVARGFWRTRGLALDEPRGYLYVANEANAWDQGTSGCLSQIELANGSVKKVAVGLDYPQFPSLEQTTGRVFVPLALHNKLVAWDPRPASAFTLVTGLDVFSARGISASVNGARVSTPDASKPQLRITIDELKAPSTLTVGVEAVAARRDAGGISMWIRIPAELLTLYKLELPYNDAFHVRSHRNEQLAAHRSRGHQTRLQLKLITSQLNSIMLRAQAGPDTFALPNVACTLFPPARSLDLNSSVPIIKAAAGRDNRCEVSVQVNHRHSGPRWPMLDYNGTETVRYRGRLFPQEGWDASPESYLIFVHANL